MFKTLKLDSKLNELFEKSAGKSFLLNKDILVDTVANEELKSKNELVIKKVNSKKPNQKLNTEKTYESPSSSKETLNAKDNDAIKEETKKKKRKFRQCDESSNKDQEKEIKPKKLKTETAVNNSDQDNSVAKKKEKKKFSNREKEPLVVKQEDVELTEKNKRTIFVGNVSINIKQSSILKKFKKLFTENCVPKEKDDFSENPSEKNLSNTSVDTLEINNKKKTSPLESIRFRSISFSRNVPIEMRKIAFRNKEFHDSRDTLNAYIVFKDSKFASEALKVNGMVFENKHLRVDLVGTNQKKARLPKQCIFIGNISFDETEEEIRRFFSDCGDIDNVRLIRDSKTNLGKGFGYVQFSDKSSVDLALKLQGKPIGERNIRIERCDKKLSNKINSAEYSGAKSIKGVQLRLSKKSKKGGNSGIKSKGKGAAILKPKKNKPKN
ncbi:Nucleolar protein 12 [Clydaea vesicula]|uniref:Nucleolar protein 12 n=1 Tax=Clydaea vesicula TaxID=447962 RepID=A0AAD5TVL6_9FUNG|nr:Nucleolar protein 12 [Clydaea vesicula]